MNNIPKITDQYLSMIENTNLQDLASFDLEHGNREKKDQTIRLIREKVKKAAGIYIYSKPSCDEILYVGKASSLYSRIRCHFEESIFVPQGEVLGIMGDKKKGLYPAYFRDLHKGVVRVHWFEVEKEQSRRLIEQALTIVLEPKFINFQKEFQLRTTSRTEPRVRGPVD